ncbi:MAG: M14 family metallocarboxypeptidase [Oscillospiraceae bacterium]|nr:M14 family metallocarboxypeptidase [Oscillospiraceae bacterium]
MSIVNTAIPITSILTTEYIRRLKQQYPFIRGELLSRTAFQRPIETVVIGTGPRKVLFTAAHHANEWITAILLLKFAEDYAAAITAEGEIFGQNAVALSQQTTIYMVPMVDPDGVDLVNGAILPDSTQYRLAKRISDDFPSVPFPDGWKANLLGVDLNLNYPAGWLRARQIKFRQGFDRPAPRDYVGRAPLNQLETQALAGYTAFLQPELVLAFHSQGKEIYWQYDDLFVEGAEALGRRFAEVSGYTLTDPPPNSSNAGYKDWFIKNYRKPGYTIEVGRGTNPLPLSQFDEIYRDNLGILILAALG